jgi:hypothetical protein
MWWLMPVIPATWEVEIGTIAVWVRPRQKVSETPSQQTSWVQWCTAVVLAKQEAEVGGSRSTAGPGKQYKTLPEK